MSTLMLLALCIGGVIFQVCIFPLIIWGVQTLATRPSRKSRP